MFLSNSSFIQAQWKTGPYSIAFETHNAGFKVHGTLSGLNLEVQTPKESNPEFSMKGSVLTHTLTTQNRTRDGHLMEEDYFDALSYPKINMESISIKKGEKDQYTGIFKITIKKYSKNIQFPFQFKVDNSGNQARLNGEFKINRRDFHVGGSSFILSDTVQVKIQVLLYL
jgi:polyisoprenoid-binding protein YceI